MRGFRFLPARLLCPSKKKIRRALEGSLSSSVERRFLGHVLVCPRCRVEFAVLRQIESESRALFKGLEGIPLSSADRAGLRDLASGELARLNSGRRAGLPKLLALRWAPAAILLTFAVAGVLVLVREHAPREAERRQAQGEIKLLRPIGESPKVPMVFQWSAIPGVVDYSLDIYTKALEPAYHETGLKSTEFRLPSPVADSLVTGDLYFWKVTARFAAGKKTESEFARVRIR
jgi:hypothetical protein